MKLKFFCPEILGMEGWWAFLLERSLQKIVPSNAPRNIVLKIELKSYEIFKYRTFDTVICFPRGLLDSMETEASRTLVAGVRSTTVEFYCILSVFRRQQSMSKQLM